ncbi:MAG TPA: FtsX-like permease family protein [Gemmatimonadaceae bacterium]|nr:FtsX-like permease family protein [Gemmatimonadaceae bacterium]
MPHGSRSRAADAHIDHEAHALTGIHRFASAALGARQWTLCRLVVNEVTRTMAGGLVVGLVGFIIAMRFAEEILFDVRPADPLVIGTAAVVFIGMAVIAAGLPARRAATIDPFWRFGTNDRGCCCGAHASNTSPQFAVRRATKLRVEES